MRVEYTYAPTRTPVPCLPLVVTSLEDGTTSEEWLALVDTGADRTVLPLSVVEQLRVAPFATLRFEVGGGDVISLPVYRVWLTVSDFPPVPVEVAASAGEANSPLGRDALNAYTAILNGPLGLIEIHDE